MGLLFTDGWEIAHPSNSAGIWTVINQSGSASGSVDATNVRTGRSAWRAYSNSDGSSVYLQYSLPSAQSAVYVGVAVYLDSNIPLTIGAFGGANGCHNLFGLLDSGGVRNIMVCYNVNTSKVELWLHDAYGGGSQLAVSTSALSYDTWYYLELYCQPLNASGSLELRINGVTEATYTGDTAYDQENVGGVILGHIDFVGSGPYKTYAGKGDVYYDDFVLRTADWPNGASVEFLAPNGDGAYSQWTAGTGATYAEVDDWGVSPYTEDDDATYLASSTVGERSSFTLTDPSVSGSIIGIELVSRNRTEQAGVNSMAHFVRVSGTDYDQTSFAPQTSYSVRVDAMDTNPATGLPWSLSDVTNLEMGIVVT